MVLGVVETWIIYIGLVIIVPILAYLSKKNKAFLFLMILVPSIIVGFRGASVGRDTYGYLSILESINNSGPNEHIYSEKGFQYLCYILIKLFKDFHWVLFVISLLSFYFYFVALEKAIKDRGTFALSSYILMCFVLFTSMSGIRQCLACSMVFYGYVVFFDKKKMIKYSVIIIFAAMIHTTSIIGFLLILGRWIFSPKINKVVKGLFLIIAVLLSYYLYNYLVNNKYNHLIVESTNGSSIGLYIYVILFISVFSFWIYKKRNKNDNSLSNQYIILETSNLCMYLALLFPFTQGLSLVSSSFGRICWAFVGFWAITMSGVAILTKKSVAYKAFIVLCSSYNFISIMLSNGYQQTPYVFGEI